MSTPRHPAAEQPATVIALLAPRTAEPELDWVLELAQLVDEKGLPTGFLRECASALAWRAREHGQRLPDRTDQQRCERAGNPPLAHLALAYVHGLRLRSDFQFAALAEVSQDWLARFPDDALVRALAGFAGLAAGHAGAPPLLAGALAAADADRTVRAVALHGLWFATQLPDQPERILALSDEMLGRGEGDANLYYWRAFALRRLSRFEEALACTDRAIALLPIGMNAVHQDYVREREQIVAARLLRSEVTALSEQLGEQLRAQVDQHREAIRQEIDGHAHTARRLVSQSLSGNIEVLGLFVAIAGFLIASGMVVFRASGFWQSFAAVGLLAAGALGFFLLLRLVVRLR